MADLDLDALFAPDVIADPYPLFARLREVDPVHWNAAFQLWVITRYEDVVWMVRNHEAFSSAVIRTDERPPYPPVNPADLALLHGVRAFRGDQLVEQDRPAHARMREVVHEYFTPGSMEKWRPFVRAAVAEFLDEVQDSGHMDVHRDLAAPLPVRVITQMMGVPESDRDHLRDLADKLLYINRGEPHRLQPLTEGIQGMIDYVSPLIDRRIAEPTNDFLSVLAGGEAAGVFDRNQVLVNAALLLFAGHETTMNLICNGSPRAAAPPGSVGALRLRPRSLRARRHRGVPAVRPAGQVHAAHCGPRCRAPRAPDPRGRSHPLDDRVRQSRPGRLRESRRVRHRAPTQSPRLTRHRHPLLPGRLARPRRRPGGLPRGRRAASQYQARLGPRWSTSPVSSSGRSAHSPSAGHKIRPAMRALHVSVDHDLCVGNGTCLTIAPSVFRHNEYRQSEVIDAAGRHEAVILHAAAQCPVGAIRVALAESGERL